MLNFNETFTMDIFLYFVSKKNYNIISIRTGTFRNVMAPIKLIFEYKIVIFRFDLGSNITTELKKTSQVRGRLTDQGFRTNFMTFFIFCALIFLCFLPNFKVPAQLKISYKS